MLHRPSFTVDGAYDADHNAQTCSPLKTLGRTKSILISLWSSSCVKYITNVKYDDNSKNMHVHMLTYVHMSLCLLYILYLDIEYNIKFQTILGPRKVLP